MVANREVRIEMSHSNRLQSVILLAIINISLVTSKKQLVILPLKKIISLLVLDGIVVECVKLSKILVVLHSTLES